MDRAEQDPVEADSAESVAAVASAQAALGSDAAALPTAPQNDQALPRGGLNLKDYLSRVEITLIREALFEAAGGVAGAARLLQMRRTTLVEKMRKYRLNG
jgi:sigma-54 specific flagellar transcriptional regulator A